MGNYIRFFMLSIMLVGCAAKHVPNFIEHQGKPVDINDGLSCRQCHKDMQDHSHPVLVPYPPTGKEKEYASVARVEESGIKLLNGQVSCGSCHDLANPEQGHPVKSFSRSQLCLVCHLK